MQPASEQVISYHTMQLDDLAQVMRIESQVHDYPWTNSHFEKALEVGNKTVVMRQQGDVMAYAVLMIAVDEAQLLNISVDSTFQGQGFGRMLMQQVIVMAKENKCATVFLEVRASNEAAIGLYRSVGFEELAIRRQYYRAKDGREDALLMELAIYA